MEGPSSQIKMPRMKERTNQPASQPTTNQTSKKELLSLWIFSIVRYKNKGQKIKITTFRKRVLLSSSGKK
jgi:hypothetical protein